MGTFLYEHTLLRELHWMYTGSEHAIKSIKHESIGKQASIIPLFTFSTSKMTGFQCKHLFFFFFVTAQVFCNMEINGGGWTVIQHREDGSLDFQKGWKEYKMVREKMWNSCKFIGKRFQIVFLIVLSGSYNGVMSNSPLWTTFFMHVTI